MSSNRWVVHNRDHETADEASELLRHVKGVHEEANARRVRTALSELWLVYSRNRDMTEQERSSIARAIVVLDRLSRLEEHHHDGAADGD